jgi:hypothetical protein
VSSKVRWAIVAFLCLVAACGKGPTPDAPTTTSAAPTPATSSPEGSSVPEADAPIATGPALRSPSSTTATTSGSSPVPATSAIDSASLAVGQLAPFLLRPGNGNRIVVEVRVQEGASPPSRTIDHVVEVLTAASGKTVTVDGPRMVAGGARAWDASSVAALADSSAAFPQGGDQVVVRLLFLRGTFAGNSSILGAAVRRDVAAVFQDQVQASGGLLVDPAVIGDATTMHEVGHLLGLVDLVLRPARGDPDHPGHSRNTGSVMHFAVESDDVAQLLGARIPTEFDQQDWADLQTIRNG